MFGGDRWLYGLCHTTGDTGPTCGAKGPACDTDECVPGTVRTWASSLTSVLCIRSTFFHPFFVQAQNTHSLISNEIRCHSWAWRQGARLRCGWFRCVPGPSTTPSLTPKTTVHIFVNQRCDIDLATLPNSSPKLSHAMSMLLGEILPQTPTTQTATVV